MKYITILWVFVIAALLPPGLSAQTPLKINITARVLDADGQPVSGAMIASEQDDTSTATDSLGSFTLEVSSGAILSVSAPGYVTKFVTAGVELARIDLSRDSKEQMVNIAYRTVARQELMGGVSHVNVAELLDKNYFTYSLSDMEGLAGGFNGSLWGMGEYLVLVDGVPRDANSVMPTEIAQVTFLKDVTAVALYGSRAAKGVVMITTKRGATGRRTINVRANAGVHLPKQYPKYLGSAEYMTLYNEARVNDGLTPHPDFTEEAIYHHAAGINPYRYPNVDYHSPEYLRDTYKRYDATVEIAGGNEKARYYTNMGYFTEGTLLNFGEAVNSRNQRMHVRGNVDMNLNRFITAKVDAAAIYYSGIGVNTNYWAELDDLRPHEFSPLIPVSMLSSDDETSQSFVSNSENLIDGKYLLGGSQLYQTNPIADIYAGGTNTYNRRQFQFNAGVNADLGDLLEGLSFHSLFGVDYSTTYNVAFKNNYAVFVPTGHNPGDQDPEPAWSQFDGVDQITTLTKYGQDASSREQEISDSWFRQTLSFSGMLNYQHQVGGSHNISAMLIAGGFQQALSEVYHRTSNANLGLHLGYNFRSRYYVDFNGALVHSARLPEANRQAFSPTVSAGWRISNEGFMAGVSAVDNLKLHVSAGILYTDLDIDDYYLYENAYKQTDGAWYTWKDGLNNRTTDSRRGANPDLTFPKREEVSVGLDVALFKNRIVFTGSAFASHMTGIVVRNNALFPSYFFTYYPETSFLPYVNSDNNLRTGFDFNLNLNERIGGIDWTLGLAGTWYKTEATRRAEIYEDAYQNRQGKPFDALWGLENDGFFMDQDDITNSPEQAFGEVRPGDIKYKDQNADGVINAQDEVYLGRYNAPLTMGVHLTARWRSLTFFVLGVARTGAYGMKNSDAFGEYFWVDGDDKYSEVVRGRWTEETKQTATYPRLTSQSGSNNFRNSDFWIFSTNRFDLARVQVSWAFPKSMIGNGNGFVRELGIYANGANLLTIAPNRKLLELNVGRGPQTRFFNVGVRAQF